MSIAKRNRRRNFFIDKDFQTRFILRFAIISTIWSVTAALLFSHFVKVRLQDALYSTHLSVRSAADMLFPTALYTHGTALLLFVLLLLYAIHALWKKLAIPLFILKKDIGRITSGDLMNPVVLREEDEFQEFALRLDAMRSDLQRKLIAIKERSKDLSQAVEDLDRTFLQDRPLKDHLDVVRKKTSKLQEDLKVFIR